ncbi:MAG: glycosyltransferase family 4 protein, partial [Oxalobacter sp.]|nr:glycosyltransferase family 4 protein [Oxalobacter sp.]
MSSQQSKNTWVKPIFPLVEAELQPNFKSMLRIAGMPVYSMHRTPLTIEKAQKTFQTRPVDGKPRIYLNLGAVAYLDNRSGIPRVVKNISREGLLSDEIELIPVYADLDSGLFHVAKDFAYTLSGKSLDTYEDVMTVAPGDTFLNVTVNPNELEFEHQTFKLLRKMGVRVLCMVHDLIPELQPEFFRKRDSRLFRKWLDYIIQYDGIVAVSQTTLAAFRHWVAINHIKLPKGFQQHWFHLGADIQSNMVGSETCDDPEAQAITAEGASPYFLQVGTIEPRKGHEDLLAGFELLWAEDYDLNLVIVGRRGWNVHQLSRKILNHPQLGKKLFWLRNADDATLHYLYRHAEAVVLASKAEGYGLPVAEGAWFKRPLLLRDIPIFREIAQDGASYFSDGAKGLA